MTAWSPGLESGFTTCVCLSSRSMFLCQGFRKYLPEVKKESARRSSTQSSEPRPKSPRERQPAGPCRRSLGSTRSLHAAVQPHHVPGVKGCLGMLLPMGRPPCLMGIALCPSTSMT